MGLQRRWAFRAQPDLHQKLLHFQQQAGGITEASVVRVLVELGLANAHKLKPALLRATIREGMLAGWAEMKLAINSAARVMNEQGVDDVAQRTERDE